jgi:hypothetical protein
MSEHKKPIARYGFRRKMPDGTYQNFAVAVKWAGKFPGMYEYTRDRGTERTPAASIIDVIKWFASGDGAWQESVESERDYNAGARPAPKPMREPGDDFGGDDSDLPF